MIAKHSYIYIHESVAVDREVDVISASTMAGWHIPISYLWRDNGMFEQDI